MGLYNSPINDVRKQINDIDIEMLELFRKRMNLIESLSYYKTSVSAPIEDKEREFDKMRLACKQLGSPYENYSHFFMTGLFEASKAFQRDLTNKAKQL